MKKTTTTFLGAMLCTTIIYFGCQKNDYAINGNKIPQFYLDIQQQISDAKFYFESTVSTTTSQKLTKVALWDKASIVHAQTGDKVIVPLQYNTNYTIKTNSSGDEQLSLEKRSHLYVYKDESGKYIAEVVTVLPDKLFAVNTVKSFSGYLIRENWSGSQQKINYYKMGQAYKFVTQNSTTNNTASQYCYYLNYYNCPTPHNVDLSDCDYLYSVPLGCGDNTTLQQDPNGGGG